MRYYEMQRSHCNRRGFLKALGMGAAVLAVPRLLSARQDGSKKPNILFIAVDDLRPELGCYGAPVISPNIDRLAAGGIVFNRAYCQSPVCGPSRASLLSGIRCTRDRAWTGWQHHADRDWDAPLSLPRHLRNHGYYTISTGKVYQNQDDGKGSWSEEAWLPPGGRWVGRRYALEENKTIAMQNQQHAGPAYECADVEDNFYVDGVVADRAVSDLRRLKEMDKPFFLAVGFYKPHLPFNAPKRYWDLYDRDKIELADNPFRPKDAPSEAIHNSFELRTYHGIPRQGPIPDEMARTLIHGYYACASYIDAQVGRLLDELDRLGLAGNTTVVLWGDHGWNLGEHTLWAKHCHFQTSLRAPLIVRVPGLTGGDKTDGLTEFIDIYPSLCELAGVALPGHLEGRSFVPLMNDPQRPWKDAVHSRFRNGETVRIDRYSYTEWTGQDGRVNARMLYDHKLDPQENVNISELPENAQLVEELAKRLRAFRAGYRY
jgi:iduronate 2-sulfatase